MLRAFRQTTATSRQRYISVSIRLVGGLGIEGRQGQLGDRASCPNLPYPRQGT